MALDPELGKHAVSTTSVTIFLFVFSAKPHGNRKYWVPGALLAAVLSLWLPQARIWDLWCHNAILISLLASLLAFIKLSFNLAQNQGQSREHLDLTARYLVASIACDVIYLVAQSDGINYDAKSYPIVIRSILHVVLFVYSRRIGKQQPSVRNTHHPFEESQSLSSQLLLTWVNRILVKGYRKDLREQDVPLLPRDIDPFSTRQAIADTWSRKGPIVTKWSLPLALLQCFKKQFLASVTPRLFLIVFRYSRPILIKEAIKYVRAFSEDPECIEGFCEDSQNIEGYWIVISAIIIHAGAAFSTSIYQHSLSKTKLMLRSTLMGLIHDKTMNLPSVAYDDGETTMLISTDADTLDGVAEMFHETWGYTIEVLIGVVLLANEVGSLWPLPLFLIYLCSYMSRYVAKQLQPRQKAWNNSTQDRLAATSSLLRAMKNVKMLGLQSSMASRIRDLRTRELGIASKLRWVAVYANASANALGILFPAITLVVFALMSQARGRALNAETAFTSLSIMLLVTHPANMVMTMVPRAAAALAGFEKVQAFLVRESLSDTRSVSSSPAILARQLNIGRNEHIVKDINMEADVGSIIAISGPTGSGKSTLARALLGENLSDGYLSISSKEVAYCAQKPWLPNGTIKQAIYGTIESCDVEHREVGHWYNEVTAMCCLSHDFKSLPAGDQTQIGSKGSSLSGGEESWQKQRVALARALFSKRDILLLDDTFSGLDGETEQLIFDNIFGPDGFAKRFKTTVILITNSAQHLKAADQVLVLGDHKIQQRGTWQDIGHSGATATKFSQSTLTRNDPMVSAKYDYLNNQLRAKDETEKDIMRQSGDLAIYRYYLNFIGFREMSILVTCTSLYAFGNTATQYWLRLWTEVHTDHTNFYAYGYLLMSLVAWATTCTQMWSLAIRVAPRSGLKIHHHLLHIVASARLSYFSETETGAILSRFSQDMQTFDKQLPSALQTLVTQICKLAVQIGLLCLSQGWLAFALPPCALFIYIIQKLYLQTSRQLRFLELQSKAAILADVLETIDGIETIRAFGWSSSAIQKNIKLIERAQRPEYLSQCLQTWLTLVLNLLTAAISTIMIAAAVILRGKMTGGQVGAAMNVLMVTSTTLPSFVQSWTTLETSLGSVARLKTLEETVPAEEQEKEKLEPPRWPSKALENITLDITAGQKLIVCGRTGSGKSTLLLTLTRLVELQSGNIQIDGIDIKHISLPFLRNRCFVAVTQDPLILPHETLRFNLDPTTRASDNDVLYAIEKTKLSKHLFPGGPSPTLLDQKLSVFQDLSVGQCQLFAVCRAVIKAQLLRREGIKPVLLLDEVTSSLDHVTEAIIHDIIEDEFTKHGHTVIIITHRLEVLKSHTAAGRDAIALVADGRLRDVITDFGAKTFQYLSSGQ
ncbi:putative ABC transporter [Xylariaceae sp. FL1019]|nr:putative ABC transporter [Xylariaceae sp. FL1019]